MYQKIVENLFTPQLQGKISTRVYLLECDIIDYTAGAQEGGGAVRCGGRQDRNERQGG